jgi:hypothetical protein
MQVPIVRAEFRCEMMTATRGSTNVVNNVEPKLIKAQ